MMLLRHRQPNAEIAIAFPQFSTYQSLVDRTRLSFELLSFAVYFILQQGLAVKEAAYGRHHPVVVDTLTDLGIVSRELGVHAGALGAYERALVIAEAAKGPHDPKVARTLTNLGVLRRELGDHAGAVEAYERALVINEAAYGRHHPQVALTLANLGNVRFDLGDHAGALEAYEGALAILEVLERGGELAATTGGGDRMLRHPVRHFVAPGGHEVDGLGLVAHIDIHSQQRAEAAGQMVQHRRVRQGLGLVGQLDGNSGPG